MLVPLLTSLVLSAAGSSAPLRVASPGLQVVNIDAKLGEFYSEHLAQQLKYAGLQVVTGREMASLIGIERQRQLLGCSEGGCMAELANALGVDALVLGDLALLSGRYQVNLKIIDATNGNTVALATSSAGSEGELVEVLTAAARQLSRDASLALGRPAPSAAEPSGGLRRLAWIPLAGGVALAGAGVACAVVSQNAHETLKNGTPGASGLELKATGETTQTLAVVGLAVGGAALVGAAAMYLFGADSPVSVAATITPTGASVGLTGVFP
ncbi:MAG: hypothetical protein JNM69_29700 [Archangium sp.]|nr:hypothetical protein [Archangium sp.]